MLTINGQEFSAVFANVAESHEFSQDERNAAAKIGDWFLRWERCAATRRPREDQAADKNFPCGYRDEMRAIDAEEHELLRNKPFFGSHLGPFIGGEHHSFTCDGFRFVVRPYTDSATMNVGVERVG